MNSTGSTSRTAWSTPADEVRYDIIAPFFLVAIILLIVALLYTIIFLCIIRLGHFALEDDGDHIRNGRIYFCNGYCYLPLWFFLRVYRRAATRWYTNEEERFEQMTRLRFSRELRRRAVERLLEGDCKTYEKECPCKQYDEEILCDRPVLPQAAPLGDIEEDEYEEQVCCICLMEYESGETYFAPQTCTHKFHKECILDWLELRLNTVCPVCRRDIVSNHDVVEMARNLQRLQQQNEDANNPDGENARPKPFRILPSIFRPRQNADSNDNTSPRIREYAVQDSDYPPPILRNQESVYLEDNNSLNTSITDMRSPDALWTLAYEDDEQTLGGQTLGDQSQVDDDGDVHDRYQVVVDQEEQMDVSNSSSELPSSPPPDDNNNEPNQAVDDHDVKILVDDGDVNDKIQVDDVGANDKTQVDDGDVNAKIQVDDGDANAKIQADDGDVNDKIQVDDGDVNDRTQVDDDVSDKHQVEEGMVACNVSSESPSPLPSSPPDPQLSKSE